MNSMRGGHAGATKINLVAGIILATASLICLFWLIPFNVASESTPGDLPPTTVPYLAAGLVLVLSLGLVIQAWRRGAAEELNTPGSTVLIELLVAASAIFVVLFVNKTLGFLAMAVPLTALTMVYAGGRKWIVVFLTAVIFPVVVKFGVWYLFTVDLN